MAADCHAKSHIDGGPPHARRLPPRQKGYVEDDHDKRVPFTAMVVEPGTSDLGICDICGLEPEEDPWKGGNDPWSPLKTILPVDVPTISIVILYPSLPPSLPTLLECSICSKDGVYDRFEAATAATRTASITPTGNDRFEPVRFDVDICAVSPDAGSEYMDMPDAVPEYIDMAELRFDPEMDNAVTFGEFAAFYDGQLTNEEQLEFWFSNEIHVATDIAVNLM